MKRYISAPHNSVYHIEVDPADPSRLLFSEGPSIKITDGKNTSTVLGSTSLGYVEGQGQEAKFWTITGFLSINKSYILVADMGNNCLRLVERGTFTTSPFAGTCKMAGFKDGIASNAKFNGPFTIINDFSPGKVIVSDRDNDAVRTVDLSTRMVATLVHVGLNKPTGMAFDLLKKNLLISSANHVTRYDMQNMTIQLVLAGSKFHHGYQDGTMMVSRFHGARDILPLTKEIALIADQYNFAIRALNLDSHYISSLSLSRKIDLPDGKLHPCRLHNPMSLVWAGKVVYIGQADGICQLPGLETFVYINIWCMFFLWVTKRQAFIFLAHIYK